MSDLPKPCEVDADNIIKPSLDEISADHRQVYEEYKKAREEKDLQEFLAKFKKDRQGNITPEQWAEIESPIADGNNLVYQTFIENTNAQKNISQSTSGNDGVAARVQNPNLALPIASAPPVPMAYYCWKYA